MLSDLTPRKATDAFHYRVPRRVMDQLVGRTAERARLGGLIMAAAYGRGAAAALIGEPGIGKTALLDFVRRQADVSDTVRVLQATGFEAEADLPFAGLMSLLRPVLRHAHRLPDVQRRALEGALAVGPPSPAARLIVHAAALGLLAAAADETPLLIVVDDAHWLDEASADALLFAARRLEGERLALLFALRPGEGRRLDLAGVEQIPLGALGRAEASQLLPGLPHTVVDRLHAATGGNPLALLEAPSYLPPEQLSGRDPLADPLPVGPGVQAGFQHRLERLGAQTRTTLLLAAAAGAEPLEHVAAAAEDLGVTLDDLVDAEDDHLVELVPGEVRFRHPLVRAVAYRHPSAPERRAAHAALAAHTGGARRARHLWGAATGPDPVAAAALEAAADEARGRTGFSAAALALERAARLTEPGEKRAARRFTAAQDRLLSGDAERAVELAREALPDARSAALTAEINGLLGAVDMLAGSLDAGFETCVAAAEAIADTDPERAAWMLSTAAMAGFTAGRASLAYDTTCRAYELARRVGGASERVAGVLLAGARLLSGRDEGDGERELLDRWPEAVNEQVLIPGAPHVIGLLQFLGWVERYDDADRFAAQVEALIAETGAVGALPQLRSGQLEIDLRRGEWAVARARASEALRLGTETGQPIQLSLPLASLARLEAAMGLEEECRASCDGALRFALPDGLQANVHTQAALGLLELGLGRADRAAEHLDAAQSLCVEYGQSDPSVVQHHPDRIEAHLRAGNLEAAHAALAEFEALAERTQRPWPLACVARCHGMLADDFEPWFARAYASHGPSESPFELGRTELVHGERLRRARRVREARERLRSALARFEALGAAPWAARARTELRAAGGALRPARTPATRELTPQELEVALAVARGATNREVAAALFVSPKTVEVHLSRVFKKLGVRSRTELATAMAAAHK